MPNRYLPIGIVCLTLLSGCIFIPKETTTLENVAVKPPLPQSAQLQAIEDEQDEKYLEAFAYWKQADEIVEHRISFLSEELARLSQAHAEQGIEYDQKNLSDQATREFLEALRFNPDNLVALDYLKVRYTPGASTFYTVREGDTFETIAQSVYGTRTYAFVVEHFSDAGREETLAEGSTLTLALLTSFYATPVDDYKADIRVARKAFKSKDFTAALPLAEAILRDHPGDEEASYIINMSLLEIAKDQQANEHYEEAITALLQVDPSFRNVKKQVQHNRELIRKRQEQQQAETRMLSDTELFKKANELSAQKKYRETMELLLRIDPGFEGRDEAVAQVRKELDIQAEYHFKRGVKFFVEENLAEAIAEWDKTLLIDPDHKNALDSREKARKLLEKYKQIN